MPRPRSFAAVLLVLAALAPGPAAAQAGPKVRRGGNLVVEDPPAPPAGFSTRMRSHVVGSLVADGQRRWAGPPVPAHVALTDETRELFVLDPVPGGGHLALYRDPYGAASCTLGGAANCAYTARLYAAGGQIVWSQRLDTLMSRPDHLEVQDLRLDGGVLYFNEACQSYSSGAGGKCSALVAVEPVGGLVLWRSPPLTSNNVFAVLDRYLITGYGFTDEPDALFVIRRGDGKVVHRRKLRKAHAGLTVAGERLEVTLSDGKTLAFGLRGFAGERPTLVPVRR